jgi:hypothetical protein
MATLDDVRRIALGLPEVEERPGHHDWRVLNKSIVWERPLRKTDYAALGDDAPEGTIIGLRVPDVSDQRALVQSGPEAVFITPHFEGWPGVLVELEAISIEDLTELIVEAWLVQAPKRLTRPWIEAHGLSDDG